MVWFPFPIGRGRSHEQIIDDDRRKSVLKEAMRIHMKPPGFICPMCSRVLEQKFRTKSGLCRECNRKNNLNLD